MNVMLWLVAVALLMSFVPPSTSPLLVFFLFFLGTVNGILIRDLGLGSKSNCTNRSHK